MMESHGSEDEIRELLWASHLGTIGPEGIARIEEIVSGDLKLRQFYIAYVRMISDLKIDYAESHLEQTLARVLDAEKDISPHGGVSSSDSRSRPASLVSVPNPSTSPVRGFLHRLLHVGAGTPTAAALMWLFMAVCTGIVLTLVVGAVLLVRGVPMHIDEPGSEIARGKPEIPGSPSPAPNPSHSAARLIHTADCHWADRSSTFEVGEALEPGRKLVLESGLAEILFDGGAQAVLEGPATLEVGSRSSALLRQGKLTATVEVPSARGFVIQTPWMKFTDLGTEFGVLVKQDGMQEMHVFRGKVQAEEAAPESKVDISTGKSGIPKSQPLLLTVNQAIRISGPSKPIERIAADEKKFVRTEQMSRIVARQSPAGSGRRVLLDATQVGAEKRLKPRSSETSVAASHDATAPGLVVTIEPGVGTSQGVELTPEGAAAWNLSDFGHVEARVVNMGAKPIAINLRVDNADDARNQPRNAEAINVQPGAAATVKTIFGYAYGNNPDFPLNPAAVVRVVLFVVKTPEPQSFRLESVVAAGPPHEKPPQRR